MKIIKEKSRKIKEQECIPVGCVPAACRLYSGVSFRGGVCLVRGCLPGPGGCLPGLGGCLPGLGCLPGPGGVCLVQGVSGRSGGVSAWSGGCLPGPGGGWSAMGGGISQHALRQTPSPPPVDRILDTRL